MLKKEEMPKCPVAITVNLIGNKWKLLILRNLFTRAYRFNELQKSLEGISQKVLTENLKAMIRDGIITRIEYDENIRHTEYKLTSLGESMRPIMKTLEQWGNEYMQHIQKQYLTKYQQTDQHKG